MAVSAVRANPSSWRMKRLQTVGRRTGALPETLLRLSISHLWRRKCQHQSDCSFNITLQTSHEVQKETQKKWNKAIERKYWTKTPWPKIILPWLKSQELPSDSWLPFSYSGHLELCSWRHSCAGQDIIESVILITKSRAQHSPWTEEKSQQTPHHFLFSLFLLLSHFFLL